jgi:hypothetical protein
MLRCQGLLLRTGKTGIWVLCWSKLAIECCFDRFRVRPQAFKQPVALTLCDIAYILPRTVTGFEPLAV